MYTYKPSYVFKEMIIPEVLSIEMTILTYNKQYITIYFRSLI